MVISVLNLGARMSRRVTVVVSVCPFTSGAYVRPVTYSAGNGGQKICGVFFENVPFKSYGVKRKRKNQYATVEPPKKGHFGNGTFVFSSEVVLLSEVHQFITLQYNEMEYK